MMVFCQNFIFPKKKATEVVWSLIWNLQLRKKNDKRRGKKYFWWNVRFAWNFANSARFKHGLSGGFWVGPAQSKVLKINFFDFSCWASSTPWGQFFRRSNLLVVWSSCATIHFQLFDIWWSSLDKINDFRAISRMVFFRFGEIINIMILSFVKKKNFLTFF